MTIRCSRAALILSTLTLMTMTACGAGSGATSVGGGTSGGVGGAAGGAAGAVGGAGGAAAAAGGVPIPTKIINCHVDFGEGFNRIAVTAGSGQIRGTLSISCDGPIVAQSIKIALFTDHGRGGQIDATPTATQSFNTPGQEQQTLRVFATCYPGKWALGFSGSLTAQGTQSEPLSGMSDPYTITDAQCKGVMP